jgi:DNA polymerase III sliding clamp (beta) subunit (PCNA family)
MIRIDTTTIKALLAVAAKSDVRFYLNAICIDVRESDVTLVATDGTILLAVPVVPIEPMPVGEYILDRAHAELIKGKECMITIEDGKIKISGKDGVLPFAPVDGKFPNWRSVTPKESSGEVAQFNPELVGRIGKAFDLLGAPFPTIHHNGKAGAKVSSDCDALGIIMPMTRCDRKFLPLPSWALKV